MNVVQKLRFALFVGIAILSCQVKADQFSIQILSAVVKDQRIEGAIVILQKNGSPSVIGKTNADGNISLTTQFGDTQDSLIIVKKPGYSNLVAKCPCNNMSYAISPVMTNLDGIRIVLNWGASPRDLDAHLAYDDNHVFWQKKQGSQAMLDVDDTDGYGPETITVLDKKPGVSYVYAVHDYSDIYDTESSKLSHSYARVLVYIGQSLVRTYYVPPQKGNLWTVFRITGDGEFQDINSMRAIKLTGAPEVWNELYGYLDKKKSIELVSYSTDSIELAKTLNSDGERSYHAGQIEQSIELYQQAINIYPEYGQAYSNLGLAHAKLGHTAEAIWANRKAIARATGPTAGSVRASSYYNIARIYESAGKYSDALSYYQDAKQYKENPVYDKAISRVKALMK